MIKKVYKYLLKPLYVRNQELTIIIRNLRKRMASLERKYNTLSTKFTELEKTIELIYNDPQKAWLFINRTERMDAIFGASFHEESRVNFHLARYKFASNYVKSKNVADIACGTGYGSRSIIEEGEANSYIGIDISRESIEYANNYHSVEGTSFICCSGEKTPMNSTTIDVVVSFETIEHVPREKALLKEFNRILKPGGLLIISTPNSWPLEIAPHHVKEYDLNAFKAALSDFFVIEEMYNQNSGTEWKYNHNQPPGIVKTTAENHTLAECFIAVCRKPE